MRAGCAIISPMTIEEIKAALKARGRSQKELAAALGVNAAALNAILAGKRPLTEQLKRHIALILDGANPSVFVFSVDVRGGAIQSCFPAWPHMTAAEKRMAIDAMRSELNRREVSI